MKYTFTLLLTIGMIACLTAQQFDSYIGFGGHDSVTVYTSDDYSRDRWDEVASGEKTIRGDGLDYPYITAARLLKQASLGATAAQVQHASQYVEDFEGWIDEQATIEPALLLPETQQMFHDINAWRLSQGLDSSELFDRVDFRHFNYGWWSLNMRNDDLLRQRLAYALSQILVISFNSDLTDSGDGVADYYDIFVRNAFGNYRDILFDVTMHPTMGYYLSHLNNPRSVPEENIHPDENYAREIMQLFSIGLYELNEDGSRKKDNNGNNIPTYDQEDITELAKVFTGLGVSDVMENMYVDTASFGIGIYLAISTLPMRMYEEWHEPGQKTILGDHVIPAGQSGMEDIQDAIDIIFNHPNVGPFIARRLIQQLVKSNPSPGYISRVTAAFNDNGEGVRGDMLAVAKAILLDDEARSCESTQVDVNNGKLVEPFLRYTHFARFVEKENYYNRIWNMGYPFYQATGQSPLLSPTVFNFYLPDFQPKGSITDENLYGPEFQIHNSRSSIAYINEANNQSIWTYLMDDWEENSPAVYANYDDLLDYGRDSEALVNYVDKHLTHGSMSQRTRTIIKNAIDPIVFGNYRFDRVRLAIYLTLISPDYAVLK